MQSTKLIIIILSLYGLASTITFITYIVKYYNLKNDCNLSNSSNLIRIEPPSKNDSLNYPQIINSTDINNITYENIISKYDIYYDTDFYNKYDLIDEYSDKIIIYSKDMKQCYKECEYNNKCYGFSKYNNYCYLKGKYDLQQKNNASKIALILNPNKDN